MKSHKLIKIGLVWLVLASMFIPSAQARRVRQILYSSEKEEEDEINHQYNTGYNVEYSVVHNKLSFASLYPEKDEQSQYPGHNIKGQKSHRFYSILDSLVAMLRNRIVVAMPIRNVSQGNFPEAAGENTPTTNDANIIFAPSRKKLDITLYSLLSGIDINYIIKEHFVKQNCLLIFKA